MESLQTEERTEYYRKAMEELREKFPEAAFEGVNFEVKSDFEKEIVFLKFGKKTVYLTRQQALDLSYALAREAKRIVKKQRKALGGKRR